MKRRSGFAVSMACATQYTAIAHLAETVRRTAGSASRCHASSLSSGARALSPGSSHFFKCAEQTTHRDGQERLYGVAHREQLSRRIVIEPLGRRADLPALPPRGRVASPREILTKYQLIQQADGTRLMFMCPLTT